VGVKADLHMHEVHSSDLLNKQDLRTNTPQRWRNEQLSTATLKLSEWQCGPLLLIPPNY